MIYELYLLVQYLSQIDNKIGFFFSFFFKKTCKVRLKSKAEFIMQKSDYLSILNLLGVSQMALSIHDMKNYIIVSFDGKNHFHINKQLQTKDLALLDLFYHGIKAGAIFVDENSKQPNNKKSLKIFQQEKYLVKTWERVFFDLENGAGAIVECFVARIHDEYKYNKNVIDIGASIGDTPLYFASKGANVFAVEISDRNVQAMKNNLVLNPDLARKITIHNKAFGKEGQIQYWTDGLDRIPSLGGSSMFANKYGKHGTMKTVQGITLDEILAKFQEPDLLKLDCKGCEFLLDLDKVREIPKIKMEFYCLQKEHHILDLARKLEAIGYEITFYKHTESDTSSMKKHGNLLAIKRQS